MCLIMFNKERKINIPKNWFKNALNHNSDGVGVFYTEKGRIKVKKEINILESENLLNEINNLKENEIGGIHLRFATAGKNDLMNCHPFWITSKNYMDKIDIVMAHNGVLQGMNEKLINNCSDTRSFIMNYLRPILKEDNFLIYNSGFQKMLAHLIGKNNKLLFLTSEKQIIIINEEEGEYRKGIWLSSPEYVLNNLFYYNYLYLYEDDIDDQFLNYNY